MLYIANHSTDQCIWGHALSGTWWPQIVLVPAVTCISSLVFSCPPDSIRRVFQLIMGPWVASLCSSSQLLVWSGVNWFYHQECSIPAAIVFFDSHQTLFYFFFTHFLHHLPAYSNYRLPESWWATTTLFIRSLDFQFFSHHLVDQPKLAFVLSSSHQWA